ncbi:MAG: hypothetical protein M1816_006337 [Peltula sp. TS41687]|nr:MAG: hypothetical protein M1816_006337 [Peltula sp. TS41687]
MSGSNSHPAVTYGRTDRVTRIHAPRLHHTFNIQYEALEEIGKGGFGTVYKAFDMKSQTFMALKIICVERNRLPYEHWQQKWAAARQYMKREIEVLAGLNHEHVVKYISHVEIDTEASVEILTELMDGSLEDLLWEGKIDQVMITDALTQTLKALDYLSSKSFVHRDVKAANILFKRLPAGRYLFKLADFGLCNRVYNARTQCGTDFFTAPEIFNGGRQTCRADVWSLFVTVLWLHDAEQLRSSPPHTQAEVYGRVRAAAGSEAFRNLERMAVEDPGARASPREMLQQIQ